MYRTGDIKDAQCLATVSRAVFTTDGAVTTVQGALCRYRSAGYRKSTAIASTRSRRSHTLSTPAGSSRFRPEVCCVVGRALYALSRESTLSLYSNVLFFCCVPQAQEANYAHKSLVCVRGLIQCIGVPFALHVAPPPSALHAVRNAMRIWHCISTHDTRHTLHTTHDTRHTTHTHLRMRTHGWHSRRAPIEHNESYRIRVCRCVDIPRG
jgi:hypothetical protein